MSQESLKRIALFSAALIGGGILLFLFFKYVFLLLLPFLLAWLIATSLERPSRAFSSRFGVSQRITRAILTLLFTAIALSLFGLLLWLLLREGWQLISRLGEGGELQALLDKISEYFSSELGELGELISKVSGNLLSSVFSWLGGFLSSFVGAVPHAVLSVIITLIAAFYFSLDLEVVNKSLAALLPDSIADVIKKFKDGFLNALAKYLRAYLILMLITFALVLVGLVAIGAPYAFLLSLLIAVLDFLPIVGAGTVLVPWGIFALATGQSGFGIGLLVLFGINSILRQIIEPRILGHNLGIHPILTLVFVYVGYSLFGIVGLFLGPVASVVLELALGKNNSADVGKSASV